VALTDDQKAMLRLLAQREEGYEDMAALMGISVEEVRERVKEALAEVAEPKAATEQAPEPPPEPAPPVAPEPPQPAEQPPAPPVAAPSAEQQMPAAEQPTSSVPGKRPPARLPGLKMPKDRGALIGLGAGALVVVIFVVVLIVGGGGDSSSNSTTTSAQTTGQGGTTPAAAENENLTEAILSPVDGGDSSGQALFGRYKKNVLLQVQAEGLEPSPQGQSYTIWLYRSPKLALQVGAVPVGKPGKIAAQFQIPPQLLAYVASGAFDQVDVSLTPTAVYKAALAKAKSERKLPPHIGESVLRGEITGPAVKKQ
jgi:hypothetical protein